MDDILYNLSNNIFNPFYPWTCFEVFHASTGKVVNLQIPAKIDPNEVCRKIGTLFNFFYAKIFLESLLAAVSPNLAMGPMIRAGTTPL